MENWKVEIKRLDAIRTKLDLNYNQLEKLSGIPRGKIGNLFRLINEPSLSFYLTIKTILENQIKVVTKEKKEVVPPKEVVASVKSTCDCRMSGTLFIRAKGCTKAKDEHKF